VIYKLIGGFLAKMWTTPRCRGSAASALPEGRGRAGKNAGLPPTPDRDGHRGRPGAPDARAARHAGFSDAGALTE